jgi:SAM-dependent methyltransferase
MALTTESRARAWGDLPPAAMASLLERSRAEGWRRALESTAGAGSKFARRVNDLALGNWHLLLLHPRSARTLDVGCGFGSLSLGLAEYYRMAVGAEPLRERVEFAALRGRQDRSAAAFVRAGGQQLPFARGAFDLVTMNGVLEWAALFLDGDPQALQAAMLREAARLLRPGGNVAVAIENRFALETLTGLPDTHTGVHAVPALPRPVADLVMRWRKGQRYRTYLHSRTGYQRLLRSAGYAEVQVLDLVSSYNDYDFVVDPHDASCYRLLHERGLVRAFYDAAGRLRTLLSRATPRLLGELSYAYLVLGGQRVRTVLDPDHDLWAALADWGVAPGHCRFACRGTRPNELAVVCHDGRRVEALVELGAGVREPGRRSILPDHVRRGLAAGLRHWKTGAVSGLACRVSLPA